MDILPREVLQTLLTREERPCVSIYMPTEHVQSEIQQNPTRFKNLVRDAKEQLVEGGMRATEAEDLLEPATRLIEDDPFWRDQSEGLAAYLTREGFEVYRFPYRFEQMSVVNNRFYVKPLLPLMSGDGRFYVLALSQNAVRLLRGTRYTVSELDLENVPQSLAEALQYDEQERQLQFHTETPPSGGGHERSAIFHGQGFTDAARDKKDILRYFQQINRGVHDLLKDEHVPLVLAGVDFLFPIYREANTYPELVEEGVTGNPEHLSDQELHDRAWEIVEPIFHEGQEEDARRYRELAGHEERSGHTVETVVPAAFFQRIDTLFLREGAHVWGRFDEKSGKVHIEGEQSPENEDLLDFAAIHTYLNGGTIYTCDEGEMPAEDPLAGIFRY